MAQQGVLSSLGALFVCETDSGETPTSVGAFLNEAVPVPPYTPGLNTNVSVNVGVVNPATGAVLNINVTVR